MVLFVKWQKDPKTNSNNINMCIKGIVKYNMVHPVAEFSIFFSSFPFDIKYEKFKFLLLFMKRERAKTYNIWGRRCSEFFNFFLCVLMSFGQWIKTNYEYDLWMIFTGNDFIYTFRESGIVRVFKCLSQLIFEKIRSPKSLDIKILLSVLNKLKRSRLIQIYLRK